MNILLHKSLKINDIITKIDDGKLCDEVLKYVTPYFYINKTSNIIDNIKTEKIITDEISNTNDNTNDNIKIELINDDKIPMKIIKKNKKTSNVINNVKTKNK